MAPTTPEEDLQTRWVASPTQMIAAERVMRLEGVTRVIVPLAQPGKEYGIWETGQVVEHPVGAYAADDARYRTARDHAVVVAARHLDGRPGTVGFAVISASGNVAVFEEILTPESLLRDVS